MPKSLGGLGADPTTIVPVFSAISVTGPVRAAVGNPAVGSPAIQLAAITRAP